MKIQSTQARVLLLTILALLCGGALLLIGCTSERVVIPPKIAKTLELPPDADGPHKGQVTATPEGAKLIAEDYAAKLAADEAKTKAARDEKIQAARDRAQEIADKATRDVARTKKEQARALTAVLDAQADELDAIAETTSSAILEQTRLAKELERRASDTLASIAAERESSSRAFAAAIAERDEREAKRVGILEGVRDLATTAASSSGPWGAPAALAIGTVFGWLGLSKPGDRKKLDETIAVATEAEEIAAKRAETVKTLVRAIDVLPETVKPLVRESVAKISTPDDEIHITEAKTALRT